MEMGCIIYVYVYTYHIGVATFGFSFSVLIYCEFVTMSKFSIFTLAFVNMLLIGCTMVVYNIPYISHIYNADINILCGKCCEKVLIT